MNQSLKSKIKGAAKEAMIAPSAEFIQRIETELGKYVTTEFLEKIRTDMVRRSKKNVTAPDA